MKAKVCKISREKGVEIVTTLLFTGKVRKEIVQSLTTDYKVSAGCIDKWIKQARPKADALLKEAESIRARGMDATITEALKDGLLSDIEIELILCKIVTAGFTVQEWVKGQIIIREVTPFEQINAARTLYQKRGSNAAPKLPKDKEGNDAQIYNVSLNLG